MCSPRPSTSQAHEIPKPSFWWGLEEAQFLKKKKNSIIWILSAVANPSPLCLQTPDGAPCSTRLQPASGGDHHNHLHTHAQAPLPIFLEFECNDCEQQVPLRRTPRRTATQSSALPSAPPALAEGGGPVAASVATQAIRNRRSEGGGQPLAAAVCLHIRRSSDQPGGGGGRRCLPGQGWKVGPQRPF